MDTDEIIINEYYKYFKFALGNYSKIIFGFVLFLSLTACSTDLTVAPAKTRNPPAVVIVISTATSTEVYQTQTPSPSPTPTFAITSKSESEKKKVCIEVHNLGIRSGPGPAYDIVGNILKGECINLIDRTADGRWARFDKGWVDTNFLALDVEIKTLPIFSETPEEDEIISPTITLLSTETKLQPSPTQKPTFTRSPTILPTNTPYVRPPTATPIIESDTIPWDEAHYYYGEYKTVCGKVVDSYYASTTSGQPTFLNIGRPYPDPKRFTVIIWGRNRGNFPSNPENYYYAKSICVKGSIENYKGSAQIEATSSSQIMVQ
jgi:uncharacterized protein YraI